MKVIGVDPAIRENGQAICILDTMTKKLEFMKFKQFVDFLNYIMNIDTNEDYFFIIEDSSMQKVTFIKGYNNNVQSSISRRVGMNQAASTITKQWINVNNYKHICVSPLQKGGKWNKQYMLAVLKAENYITDVPVIKITQDMIDAFTLVFKFKPKSL